MAEDFLTEAFISLRDRWKAEDALAEAFCRLWGKYKAGSLREAVGMLSKTERNIRIDEWRRASRRKIVSVEEVSIPDEPDGKEEMEALFRRVEEKVDSELTPLQRRIVRLHEYEGQSFDRIARKLDMRPEAVRMNLSRARKTLRDKFRDEYEKDQ